MDKEVKSRKMALIVQQVSQQDEYRLDMDFWLKKSVSERLAEVCRLRRLYFNKGEEGFPTKIAKVVHKKRI
nr:hypothetical protein [Cytophagales bacterium]